MSVAVHEAVAKNTELDLMHWVMRRAPLYRLTCRHAAEIKTHVPVIAHTKDGRWFITHGTGPRELASLIPFLGEYGMAADLKPPDASVDLRGARNVPGSTGSDEGKSHMLEVIQRFIRAHTYENVPWQKAQDAGLLWAPLRKPHENALDEHWLRRHTFSDIEHPELGRCLPLHDEQVAQHAHELAIRPTRATDWRAHGGGAGRSAAVHPCRRVRVAPMSPALSARGKPFALQGIRILDFSWFLASAGGTRLLAGLGAESLKVEWKGNPDTRMAAMAPVGGRAARERATAPLPGVTDPDMGGNFNHKNAGKRGISLNVRDPRGLEIAKSLVRISDVVAEGFSPGVLDRLGLGYDVLRDLKPDIIYVQQAGMGAHGVYGRMRTVGPVAASFAGTSDMSGLPEPAMPAGWGYSFLDWMGAYSFALAILGALYHRARTGEGQWIDASQCEAGLFLNGVPVLDWSANGRAWMRYGNRSPYKPAAPHGAYRCEGEDRWIAIACFTDAEWDCTGACRRAPGMAARRAFRHPARRGSRIRTSWTRVVSDWTRTQDARDCMERLQRAGVPAGVCQDAEDRCERDPQLAELQWLTELTGTKIGRWPVAELLDEDERHAALRGRHHRPRRALLRRGQRARADHAARPVTG